MVDLLKLFPSFVCLHSSIFLFLFLAGIC
uniref:Uncharacterized protein n=1 Tax=Rhizophora mucronata TaxID=61149 RepID=A0A2P2N8X1_RHIMU